MGSLNLDIKKYRRDLADFNIYVKSLEEPEEQRKIEDLIEELKQKNGGRFNGINPCFAEQSICWSLHEQAAHHQITKD